MARRTLRIGTLAMGLVWGALPPHAQACDDDEAAERSPDAQLAILAESSEPEAAGAIAQARRALERAAQLSTTDPAASRRARQIASAAIVLARRQIELVRSRQALREAEEEAERARARRTWAEGALERARERAREASGDAPATEAESESDSEEDAE